MTTIFLSWLLLASIQLAATMSPGPAFALTVRNAIAHHRKAGLLTACGLGLGVGIHVIFVLTGLSIVISEYPPIFLFIKYAGAAYLIYIGIKGLTAKAQKNIDIDQDVKAKNPNRKPLSFLTQGLMTNILNPKAWVFFPAIFLQFITPETPTTILTLYGLTSVLIETIWFSCMTIFLTAPKIRQSFLSISHWIDKACGGLLIALGVKLILDKGLKAAT